MDVEGRLVGDGDFETQTRQVFSNLLAALSEAGAEVSDLVKIGIYVVDHSPEKLGVVRQVRDEILGDDPPVSTLLGVDRLAFPGLMIEVDAVAVID
jgi:enamine deaminase RidA (YjgF/YER057c/UK114 family)